MAMSCWGRGLPLAVAAGLLGPQLLALGGPCPLACCCEDAAPAEASSLLSGMQAGLLRVSRGQMPA